MTKLQPPPAYNSRGGHGPPSAYTVPTQFQIGASNTDASLVRIPEIKGHLALLRMFAELKNKVVELGPGSAPYVPVEAEKRWSWFVALAVERYVSSFLFLQVGLEGCLGLFFSKKVRYLVPGVEIRGCEENF